MSVFIVIFLIYSCSPAFFICIIKLLLLVLIVQLNITTSILRTFPIARDRNNIVSSQNHMDSSIKLQNVTEQLKVIVMGRHEEN